MAITVSIPHQLTRAEAHRRIEIGFAKIVHLLPGNAATCSERWEGDRLLFTVVAMAQPCPGSSTSSTTPSRWRSSCPVCSA